MLNRLREWYRELLKHPKMWPLLVLLVTINLVPRALGYLVGQSDWGHLVANVLAFLMAGWSWLFSVLEKRDHVAREEARLQPGERGVYRARCHCCEQLFPERFTKRPQYGFEIGHPTITSAREIFWSWHCIACAMVIREARDFQEAVDTDG